MVQKVYSWYKRYLMSLCFRYVQWSCHIHIWGSLRDRVFFREKHAFFIVLQQFNKSSLHHCILSQKTV